MLISASTHGELEMFRPVDQVLFLPVRKWLQDVTEIVAQYYKASEKHHYSRFKINSFTMNQQIPNFEYILHVILI